MDKNDLLNTRKSQSNNKHDLLLKNRKSSVAFVKDECFETTYKNDKLLILEPSALSNDATHMDFDYSKLKPPVINSSSFFKNPGSSKGSSRRTSVAPEYLRTPPQFSQMSFPSSYCEKQHSISNLSSPSASKNKSSKKSTPKINYKENNTNFKSMAPIKSQTLETGSYNIYNGQQDQVLNPLMMPIVPLQIGIPSPFDYNYGSYLIPTNLLTPYSANVTPNYEPNSYFQLPSGSAQKQKSEAMIYPNLTNKKISPLTQIQDNELLSLYVTYQYAFIPVENNIPLETSNSIIFTNLNENITVESFGHALNILTSKKIKSIIQFKVDKSEKKEINSMIIQFFNHDTLDGFVNEFIRDLSKWVDMLKSDHLLFKKCILQTSCFNDKGVELFGSHHVSHSRSVLVDCVDIKKIINALKVNALPSASSDELSKVYLKILNIQKVQRPHIMQELGSTIEFCYLIVFHNPFYKAIALELIHRNKFNFDVYEVNNLIFSENKDGKIINSSNQDFEIEKLSPDFSEYWISKFSSNASFISSPFTSRPYDIDKFLNNNYHVKVSGNFNKIINGVKELSLINKKSPSISACSRDDTSTRQNSNSVDSIPLTLSSHNSDVSFSPESTADSLSITSDTYSGEILFDSRRPSIFKSNSDNYCQQGIVKKDNFSQQIKNRLIFIANLPPVVKTFDIINVIRGGILEQIQYASGQRYCFIKFISADSAKNFFLHSQKNGIVLHGYVLTVQYGKKGESLAPVSSSLLQKVSLGASRNVYLSLPEFAYKKKYLNNPKYKTYHHLKLPKPEVIIDDFSLMFGALEQINFAEDEHCCWINFMSIHSAIKLLDWLHSEPQNFHFAFEGKYEGLVLKYGKDRCEKNFKNFNSQPKI
ncbi:hypothetical protein QEN19_003622 [Hanseniaspora menglaensis]